MNNNPRISVIMPLYNSSNYLRHSINGILSQTEREWELLIIDDASNDDSYDIARKYSETDERIKVIKMPINSGPAISRNIGIEKAKGRYIAFCDSDDIWKPEKLRAQLDFMEKEGAAICFSSYVKMKDNGDVTDKIVKANKLVTYKMMLKSNFIGFSTSMYDVCVCGKVMLPNIKRRHDYALWLKIMSKGIDAKGIEESFVYYRVRKKSVSSNKITAALYHWIVLSSVDNIGVIKKIYYFINYIVYGFIKRSA